MATICRKVLYLFFISSVKKVCNTASKILFGSWWKFSFTNIKPKMATYWILQARKTRTLWNMMQFITCISNLTAEFQTFILAKFIRWCSRFVGIKLTITGIICATRTILNDLFLHHSCSTLSIVLHHALFPWSLIAWSFCLMDKKYIQTVVSEVTCQCSQ